jgi:hypothetical protein
MTVGRAQARRLAHQSGHRLALAGEIGGGVRLVEHHHRAGAAGQGEAEEAFQPTQVEVAVEPHHQQHQVDVGRHHLLLVTLAHPPAREAAVAGQHGANRQQGLGGRGRGGAGGAALHRHPVADRGQLGRAAGLVAQATRGDGQVLGLAIVHTQELAVLEHHPRRAQLGRRQGGEGRLPDRRVAKRLQAVAAQGGGC